MSNRVLRDWSDSERIDILSMGAEVFFTRLMMKADDYGCFTGNLKLVKASLFPLKESIKQGQIIDWITECQKAGIVEIYEFENKPYLYIYNFGQRLRAMTRKYPEFTTERISTIIQLTALCQQIVANMPRETKRRETKQEDETKGKSLILETLLLEYGNLYPKDMITAFHNWWSEKNGNGKEKWTLQETWETSKRLATWHKRSQETFKWKPETKERSVGPLLENKLGLTK